ncbi:unnamed protein product [Nippostrongylus brasiliensis]|uniref:Fibropellin-1 n=1 Tax=Nippostrongylus brasiliensis TaxID=27835 RepID=A0A158R0A6_NIPBR|nr:unnamed protein product [Nippostrongylus brasiliensis]
MRWTVVVLLSALRSAQSDSYPYSWTIGDVRLTCDLGNPGWKLAGRSCFFAFRTKNQTWNAANQMCRNYVFGHSHGAWTKNWLLARSLLKILPAGVYWTGYRSSQSSDRLEVGWEYMDTSIFNPTWASDQPSADGILDKCVALDLRSERTVGWRLVNCAEPLPALCETFACMDDEFRCTDNSRCIPRSAVLDEIVDCGDGSDEKTRNLALLGRKTANNNYHTMSSLGCQNLVPNAPKGTITSPNYPRNYSQWTFCQWDIHAQPGHILVFNVKDLDLSTNGSLTLEGSGAGGNLSLTNGSYPTSYVINSNMVRVRFAGGGEGDGRGFVLHYFSKAPSEVCRSATDGFTYESWKENTDCTYTFQSGAVDAYTVLEVNPIFMGNRTTVTVTFGGIVYPLTNLRAMEVLVIPYNVVQVQVRNAWLSEQYTAVSKGLSDSFLAEPLELTLSIGSFSIKWFASRNDDHSTRSLTLDLRGGQDTKVRPHTLAIDGVQTKSDAVTAIMNGKVIRLPPSGNIRMPNLSHDVFLLMSKRSPSFQLSGHFSVDCPAPSLPSNVQMVPGSQRHLGGVVQFTCVPPGIMADGPSSAVCLVGGQWSAEPPICLESETVFCPLPVVQSGYVLDVVSSCRENIYCEGAQLSYGCDLGKLPDALCSAPEPDYRNASLVNSTSLGPLAHALYRPPQWSLPEQPFRVCAIDETGQSYDWLDYNFKFQAPICRSYPIPYGSFDQPFYSDGEMARVNCLDGFVVSGLPTCIGGEWSTLAFSCKEPSIPPDACRNGQVVKLQPGYSCNCNPGYEVVKQAGKYTCGGKCSRDLHNPDLVSGTGQAFLLQHMKVSCVDKKKFMIGSDEMVCAIPPHPGTPSLAPPVSPAPAAPPAPPTHLDLHCPIIDSLLSPLLEAEYSDPTDKARVGTWIDFRCKSGSLKGHKTTACVPEGSFSARWSNAPPDCEQQPTGDLDGVMPIPSRVINRVESLQRDMDWHNFADDDFIPHITGDSPQKRFPSNGGAYTALDRLFNDQLGIYTGLTPRVPSLDEFAEVARTSRPGFVEIALDGLGDYLTVSIVHSGSVILQSVKLFYKQCDAATFDGMQLSSSFSFSKPRPVPVLCRCPTPVLQTYVTAVCHPTAGWALQTLNPCCTQDFTKSRFCELQNDWICPTCEPHHKCLMIIASRADAAQRECVCAYEGRLGDCPPDPCRAHNCWVGEECRSPITCISTEDVYLCENGGTCDTNSTSPTCHCLTRFTGPTCNHTVDLCAGVQCLNGGSCLPTETGHFCYCASRFTGPYCEVEIDLCAEQNPCQQGNCLQETGHLRCNCSAGWSGEFCDVQLDLCQVSDPCVHGNCRGVEKDLCTSFTCENGGTCKIRDHSAKCDCIVGYGGAHCEQELTECEDFPEPLPCLNGGTCRVTADHRQYCECSINFYGTNCEVFGRSCAVINCNNGTCFNDTMLEGHCICPPDRTGEFCETVKSTSFNLYFNGQPSTQTIVSRDFPSTFLKEFTLCAWVFYAPLQPSDGSSLGRFLQLNTTTGAPILSMDNTGLTINDSFHIDVKISVMAWHHVCVRSPRFQDSDHPMWSVFLDGTFAANVSYAELAVSADLRCRIQIGDAGGPHRFRGEISLVHLYTAYLEDADIAKMAFQCRDWVATENPHLLLQWTDFTTVQRNNPGVMALYPGLCDVSDCLPGRSSCNTKDKIPPTVKSCPRNIRKLSSDWLTRVKWDTDEMFTDNVGVAAVKSNYRSGQSFTWGYYTVVYVASDAAGNTAACSFSVVVSPAECQTPTADSQLQGEVTFTSVNGTDATKTARVSCDDPFYPRNGPDFYICDVMGQWDRSIFWPANRTYIFSSCGATRDPAQTINGTLEDYGNCSSIRQSLFDSLENDLRRSNCTGEYWSEINYTCAYCPKDTYRTKTDPLGSCTACPVNKTTSEQIGQKTSAACHDICSAGQFYNDFTRKCQLCPRGTYQERRGATACVPCSSDATTTIEGAKNATDCFNPCGPGEELVADEANCVPCAKGTYWVNGSFTGCQVCPQGLTTFDTGCKDIRDCEVVTCPVGTHVNINRTDPVNPLSTAFDLLCIKCEMGTYQDENNQTSCKPCTPTSNCDLVNECSPLLPDTCAEGNTCKLIDTGIYSCSTVIIQPAPERSKWIIWVVAPLVAVPVRPIETISTAATVAPPRLSLEDPTRIRLRERHLPPPIITSKVELDLLEEQARTRRTLVSNVLPVSSRSLGSQIVTGYSNESPGPSISAQLAPPRHRTFSGGQQPYLCDLPEDPSSSYSLHWSETTPGDSNDVYGDDDDDEDYFG